METVSMAEKIRDGDCVNDEETRDGDSAIQMILEPTSWT